MRDQRPGSSELLGHSSARYSQTIPQSNILLPCDELDSRRELHAVECEKFGILYVKYRSVHYAAEERTIHSV